MTQNIDSPKTEDRNNAIKVKQNALSSSNKVKYYGQDYEWNIVP